MTSQLSSLFPSKYMGGIGSCTINDSINWLFTSSFHRLLFLWNSVSRFISPYFIFFTIASTLNVLGVIEILLESRNGFLSESSTSKPIPLLSK